MPSLEPRPQAPGDHLVSHTSRAVVWNMVFIPVQGLVALASSAVIARTLSNQEYAVYGLALAALASFLLWTDLGMTPAVSRYVPLVRPRGGHALQGFLRKAVTARGAALLAALAAVPFLRESPAATPLLPLERWGIALLFMAVAAQAVARLSEYFLSGLLDRRSVGAARIAVGLLHPLLLIAGAAAGLGVTGILAALAIGSIADMALFGGLALRRARAEPAAALAAPIPPDIRARIARFAAVSFVDKAASHLNSPGFAIFLVAALGVQAEVAAFAVAGELGARVLAVLATPLAGLSLPFFATVEATRPDDLGTAARLYLVVMVLFSLPAAGLLFALADPLVTVIYSSRYVDAVPILRASAPFLLVEYAVFSALLAPLLAREQYGSVVASKLPLMLGLAGMFWTIPRWGAVGAAVTFGVARILSAALLIAAGRRALGLVFPWAFAARVAAATMTASAASLLVSHRAPGGPVAAILSASLVAAVVFVGTYRVLGGMDPEDKALVVKGIGGDVPLGRLAVRLL